MRASKTALTATASASINLALLNRSPSGHEVTLAEGGEQAMSELEQAHFDLVLSDLNMPGMDGTALLKAVKSTHKDLPVVIITGYGTFHTEKRVMKEGADGYISKPCTLAKIERTLSSILSAKQRLS